MFPLDSAASKSSQMGCTSHLCIYLKRSCYGRFEICSTHPNSLWKKMYVFAILLYSLNPTIANQDGRGCSSNLPMHMQPTTTAATIMVYNKPSAQMVTQILSLSKQNKWYPPQTQELKLKPSTLLGLIGMGSETPLER